LKTCIEIDLFIWGNQEQSRSQVKIFFFGEKFGGGLKFLF